MSTLSVDSSERVVDHGDHNISTAFHQNELEHLREKLRVMIDAVSLVSKLASVDSVDYQSYCINHPENTEFPFNGYDDDSVNDTPRLGNNSRILVTTKMVSSDRLFMSQATSQYVKKEKRDDSEDFNDVLNIQHLLDSLQTHGDLRDTALPILIKCIHRLQSNVTHLQAEAETNAVQIHTLHEALSRSNDRIQQLEDAVQALYQEKTEIKSQLKFKKKECRYFAKSVREYITMKRTEELEKDALYAATRVSVHESMLKSLRSKKKGDTLDMDADHLSIASSLDDFDTLRKYDSVDMSSFDICLDDTSQSFDLTRISSGESPESLRRYVSYSSRQFYPTEPRDRAISTDSLVSTQSCVTDTCVPTVRFDVPSDDPVTDPELKSGTQTYEYVLKEGSHVGLVFKLMDIAPPRQPLLDGKLLDVADCKTASSVDPAIKNSPLKGQGISSKIDDFFSRTQNHSKRKDSATVTNEPDCAVIVCGFDNFDDSLNKKPSLGARLIAVGDESLLYKKNLCLEMIHEMIIKASDCECAPQRTVKLVFRYDPLTRDQKNKLHDINLRADSLEVKDEPTLLDSDKPKFLDKIFSSMSRDHQRREKGTQPDCPQKPVSSGSDMLKRDFFKINL